MANKHFRTRPVNRHWTGTSATVQALAAGSQAVLIFPAQHAEETWMRMRGALLGYVDGVQAPGNAALITCGMILVPEGSGTTVQFLPFTDDDAPWFYWETFTLGYEEYVTDVIDSPGLTSYRSVIDAKAMRIVRPDTEIQFVVENTTAIGSGLSCNVSLNARVLTQQ